MKREISQRWVLSFADLTLLLLAFFVMMQAQAGDRLRLAAGMRDAFGGGGEGAGDRHPIHGFAAASIFEADEAILKPEQASRLRKIGAEAAKAKSRVIVASQGRDGQSVRLDSWELAAARTTAVARAIRAGGVPDAMIEIAIPPMRASEQARGQRISVQQL
ncbi:MAG: flagellar motor protein [Sphingomonadales bacterium]|nr:MAG: flagellar motor protein [Sphingomonadales bacterium]